jgi:hypothetical protein
LRLTQASTGATSGRIERGEFNITIGTPTMIAAGLDVPAWALLKGGDASSG